MTAQVRLFWQVSGNQRLFMNTFQTFLANVNYQQAADAVRTTVDTHLKPRWPNTVSLVRVTVTAPGAEVEGMNETAVVGTHAAYQLCPPNTTFLVTKIGGPRKRRGRLYLPAVDESIVDNLGNISTAAVATWNTSLANWLSALSSAGVPMHNNPTGDGTVPTSPVTALTMSTRVATQRRRLRTQ